MDRYSSSNHRLGKFIFLLFALTVISGCSGKTMVVLVPDPGGKTGTATVSNPTGGIVLETANQATTISGLQSPPSAPKILEQREINRIFSRALKAQPKPPIHFTLYFISDSNELRADSIASLPAVLKAIEERNSIDITIVGHTDTMGHKEYNYALSKSRAEAVAGLLVGRGVLPDHLQSTSHGEENPLIQTGDNVSEPRNRRVEVVVR